MLRRAVLRRATACFVGMIAAGALAACELGQRDLPPLTAPNAALIGALSSSSAASSPGFPASILDKLPLGLDDLDQLAGEDEAYRSGGAVENAPRDYLKHVDPPACMPAMHALQNSTVASTTYKGFRLVSFVKNGDRPSPFVQIFAVYAGAAAAKAAFGNIAAGVSPCADKDVVEDTDSADRKTTVHVTVEESDPAKIRWTQHRGPDDQCVQDVRLVDNLVFEVVECGSDPGELAAQTADALVNRAV